VNLARKEGDLIGGEITDISGIIGGLNSDLLIGNDAKNTIVGGHGRDVIIGGFGADLLSGGTGDDLIVGGGTTFDLLVSDLNNIRNEWTSADTYGNRVAHLLGLAGGLNGGTVLTPGLSIPDDSAIDKITGGEDTDWYVGATSDLVSDAIAGETRTTV
jgi:Ca2+-binding RTX toxin-like protein